MNIHHSAGGCFELYPLRFRFAAREPIYLPAGESANILRGWFGKALWRANPDAYARYFRPSTSPLTSQGPSGLRDLPRPFVFRVAHLDGARLAPGETFEIGMNLFEIRERPVEIFRDALCSMLRAQFLGMEGEQLLRLPLGAGPVIERVRVRFVTPTELKGAKQLRLRRPVRTHSRSRQHPARALFGAGPLPYRFQGYGRARPACPNDSQRSPACGRRALQPEHGSAPSAWRLPRGSRVRGRVSGVRSVS